METFELLLQSPIILPSPLQAEKSDCQVSQEGQYCQNPSIIYLFHAVHGQKRKFNIATIMLATSLSFSKFDREPAVHSCYDLLDCFSHDSLA